MKTKGNKLKVVIIQPIHPSGIEILKSNDVEVCLIAQPSIEAVTKKIIDANGIIVRSFLITEKIIHTCKSLRVIGRYGAGVDNIDISAATDRGIPVVYTPGIHTKTVAEHTLALIFGLAKRLVNSDSALRRGEWNVREENATLDLDGKVLGIIGYGRIGKEVARKAVAAFEMSVLAYDPYIYNRESKFHEVRFVDSLDDLLHESDFVSIHVPSSDRTKGMIGSRELAKMKPTSFLINTSRGDIIDESALIEVLRRGKIAGAGLDVFEIEPPRLDNPLLQLPNVIVTPHLAGMTAESVVRLSTAVAQGILDVFQGRRPAYVFNPEVYDRQLGVSRNDN